MFFIVESFLKWQSFSKCQDEFGGHFPVPKVPNKSTIFHLVSCFQETGCVDDHKHSGHQPVLTKKSLETVLHVFTIKVNFKSVSTNQNILWECSQSNKEAKAKPVSLLD